MNIIMNRRYWNYLEGESDRQIQRNMSDIARHGRRRMTYTERDARPFGWNGSRCFYPLV